MNPPTATAEPNHLVAPTDVPFDPEAVANDLEDSSAQEALRWALETFHPKLYIACSFQKTNSVLIDMAFKINPETRFFYLDTDVLFDETYATRDRFASQYGIEFERYHNLTIEEQAEVHGPELWNRDPDACCGIRKIDPMREALGSVDCWVSGIRRSESQGRSAAPKFSWDKRFGLWKLNPIADWTERDVWKYIHENDVPYNPLHDQNYPSIGCTHCTSPVTPGSDERAGRWAGTKKTECGLH